MGVVGLNKNLEFGEKCFPWSFRGIKKQINCEIFFIIFFGGAKQSLIFLENISTEVLEESRRRMKIEICFIMIDYLFFWGGMVKNIWNFFGKKSPWSFWGIKKKKKLITKFLGGRSEWGVKFCITIISHEVLLLSRKRMQKWNFVMIIFLCGGGEIYHISFN